MWASLFAGLICLSVAFGRGGTAGAGDAADLGYREDTVIQGDENPECAGVLTYNHDHSFENGYCWQYDGIALPYYGAFAEGFDLGCSTTECAVYWLTNVGDFPDPIDVYIWDGGVHGPPASVLCLVPGVSVNVGYWPECAENRIEVGCAIGGEIAVGYWTDSSSHYCTIYCAADENGGGGHPWTCIAPGIGYPDGWQHPNVVYPNCVSMGIGVTVTDNPSPVEGQTWGAVKALFRE